jgi:cobalt-zinc-cadmium efflux system outer membrane protein
MITGLSPHRNGPLCHFSGEANRPLRWLLDAGMQCMITFSCVYRTPLPTLLCLLCASVLPGIGCQTAPSARIHHLPERSPAKQGLSPTRTVSNQTPMKPVSLIAFETEDSGSESATTDELGQLVAIAQSTNPKLVRLEQEANAASSKTHYIDKLPDPTFGANVFGHPIETAAGSQRGNLTLMQMVPWLDRLEAQQQQACFEAMALRQKYAAERLRVIGNVRVGYYRLYVLTRQIETVEANQKLLETLIAIVNARVATGKATQGDVLLGTLELSRLEKKLITLRQQIRSTEADINRLANRPMSTSIDVPENLIVPELSWTHEMLVQTANERQPVIAAAQLQANATRWGVNVAELRRRPDFQIGAAWFFMDNNRPATNIVDVGRDAWSVGATVSIPLDREKYDAIREEALWKHAASRSNVEDTRQEFNARLLDLLEQARAANATANLYQHTILPQSEQTLASDQESLADGTVEFDRVIQDFRNLLTLEFGYHRATGQLAISIAQIQQAVGIDIQ